MKAYILHFQLCKKAKNDHGYLCTQIMWWVTYPQAADSLRFIRGRGTLHPDAVFHPFCPIVWFEGGLSF